MSNMNSMEREQKKRKLKQNMIEAGQSAKKPVRRSSYGEDGEAVVKRAERKVRRKRVRIFFSILVVLAIAGAFGYQYIFAHQYTSFTVTWEKKIPAIETGFTAYESFGDNILKYTKDGATYIDKSGNAIWSLGYQMKSPICYVNGDYAVIADQQGNSVYIYDKTGCQGEAVTLLPILRASISAYGVAAVLVEDSKASYITFFKKDGSVLDWGIKTVMARNGYIVDVSLSPDGTQVMLSDAYIQDGMLKNRIVFYNFSEFGKSYPDRLVGGFDDFGDELCPRVRFLDEGHACAFTDGRIVFYSLENVTSPEEIGRIEVAEEIRSIMYSDKYAGIVVNNPDGEYDYRLDVYKSDGTLAFSEKFSYQYKQIDIDGDMVILYNENSCKVYSISGKERFNGMFDFTVSKIRRGSQFNSLIITGGDTVREIRLK